MKMSFQRLSILVFTTALIGGLVKILCVFVFPSSYDPPAVLIKSTGSLIIPLGGEGVSTLHTYTKHASYFDECGFKHQPEEIEVHTGR